MEYDRLSGRALGRDSCRRLNEHTGRLYINKLDKRKSKGVQCTPALLTQFDGSESFEIHIENIHERESKVLVYVANKPDVKDVHKVNEWCL